MAVRRHWIEWCGLGPQQEPHLVCAQLARDPSGLLGGTHHSPAGRHFWHMVLARCGLLPPGLSARLSATLDIQWALPHGG